MSEPYWIPVGGAQAGVQKIFDQTLVAAAASFNIPSIPGIYSHLRLDLLLRCDPAAVTQDCRIQFNGDTTANYDTQGTLAAATGISASESLAATGIIFAAIAASATAGYFAQYEWLIQHYAGITNKKVASAVGGSPAGTASAFVQLRNYIGVWRTLNAAISSITIAPLSGNFVAGSRCTLYGVV